MIAVHSPSATLRTRSAKRTFSSTVSQGSSAASGVLKKHNPVAPGAAAPAVGRTSPGRRWPARNPARMLSRVDLPQPEGPKRQTNSPSAIVSDTPSRATIVAAWRFEDFPYIADFVTMSAPELVAFGA